MLERLDSWSDLCFTLLIMNDLKPSKSVLASTALKKVGGGLSDFVLLLVVLCFTGVAIVAVAIAAPLALAVSALIGTRGEKRTGWQTVKAS